MNVHSLFPAASRAPFRLADTGRADDNSQYRDRADCERLLLACYSLMDRGCYEASSELFSEDAIWVRDDGSVHTRRGILATLTRHPPQRLSRHLVTNVVVTPFGDQAEARAYMIGLQGAGQPVCVYDLVVRFRRSLDWEITYLEPTEVFGAATAD